MKTIDIHGTPFRYEEQDLYVGMVEKITFEQARDILFFAKELLERRQIPFGLAYGTLLGAVREHSFISHDYDVDLWVADFDRFLEAIPEFDAAGLKLCRVTDGRLYSFAYGGVYIDMYVFRKAPFPFSLWCHSLAGAIVPKKYFRRLREIDFLGGTFRIPDPPEPLLAFWYGSTWRTPLKTGQFQGRDDIRLVHFYRKHLKKYLFWKK